MIVNNCKVLIVEDDHSLRLSLTAFLKNHHFQVSNAQNGEEGLLLCKHDPFDIIVTDIRMPFDEWHPIYPKSTGEPKIGNSHYHDR